MNTMKILIAVALCLVATAASAQYAINWYKVAGGGGTSTSSVYSVSGTIGQHDAGGPLTGGGFSLTGGFWSFLSTVQTPGAPLLTISLTTSNTAMVFWPSPSAGFTLQQNTNSLASPAWGNVPTTPIDNGTIKYVIVNPPVGSRFYRLSN
jgi:hypothetical protein